MEEEKLGRLRSREKTIGYELITVVFYSFIVDSEAPRIRISHLPHSLQSLQVALSVLLAQSGSMSLPFHFYSFRYLIEKLYKTRSGRFYRITINGSESLSFLAAAAIPRPLSPVAMRFGLEMISAIKNRVTTS